MPIDEALARQVLAQIDRDELAQLACDIVSIPSPTGQEKGVAEHLLAWSQARGLKAVHPLSTR